MKAHKIRFSSFAIILSCKIFFAINVGKVNAATGESPKFSAIMIYLSQMILDEGVILNEVINNEKYILLKGIAPSQQMAFLLAEKLFHSNMQKDFQFKDIIPFWDNNRFTFYLQKKSLSQNLLPSIEITYPASRAVISEDFVLRGKCSKDKSELNLSGSVNEKLTCRNGAWSVQISISGLKTNMIGLKVSEGVAGTRAEDYRSFLIEKP